MDISRNIPVEYDDAQHRYSYGQIRYISSTQVVEKFRPPFPDDAAEKYAKKHGGTAEYWKDQWRRINEESQVRGNRIHDSNEVALHGRMIDIFKGRQLIVQGDFIREEDPWIGRPDGVYTERKLWHHGYQIAGRADKIILLTDHGDNGRRYANIDDYKTNKRLDKESYQFRDGSYKRMLPPLGHVMDSNWWHYQLQLSLYMFMLEYQGFTPGTMTITHYPHPTEETPMPKPQVHEVTYMKREVLAMLNYLRR